jgi:hypothetical protein
MEKKLLSPQTNLFSFFLSINGEINFKSKTFNLSACMSKQATQPAYKKASGGIFRTSYITPEW